MSAEWSIPLSSLWYRWLSEIEIIIKFFSSGTAQINSFEGSRPDAPRTLTSRLACRPSCNQSAEAVKEG